MLSVDTPTPPPLQHRRQLGVDEARVKNSFTRKVNRWRSPWRRAEMLLVGVVVAVEDFTPQLLDWYGSKSIWYLFQLLLPQTKTKQTKTIRTQASGPISCSIGFDTVDRIRTECLDQVWANYGLSAKMWSSLVIFLFSFGEFDWNLMYRVQQG